MKIVLIRHGEPDNPHNTLTKKGFEEIEALSKYLRNFEFKQAFTSPLARAKLTCEAVLKPLNREAIVLPWLQEFTHKVNVPHHLLKQMNWDFLPSFFTSQDDFYLNDKYLQTEVMQSGEVDKYYQEVTDNFDLLLENYGYKRDGKLYHVIKANRDTLVFFCHFGVMSVILSHLMNIPYLVLAQSFICPPTGITTLVTEEREKGLAQFRCLKYGSITHLEINNMSPSFHGRFCETYDSDERH